MRAVIASGTVIAFCCLAWFSTGGVASAAHERITDRQDFPPRPGGTPIIIGLPNLTLPTATAVTPLGHGPSVTKPAPPPDPVRVALSNAYVRALVKGKAYRIQRVAPWPAGKGKLVVVGFYSATTVSGTWIVVGKPPYHATYRTVVGLQIYVQPARGVVGISPRHSK